IKTPDTELLAAFAAQIERSAGFQDTADFPQYTSPLRDQMEDMDDQRTGKCAGGKRKTAQVTAHKTQAGLIVSCYSEHLARNIYPRNVYPGLPKIAAKSSCSDAGIQKGILCL